MSFVCDRFGLNHHLKEGKVELTHVAMLSPQKEVAEDRTSRGQARESIAIEIDFRIAVQRAKSCLDWLGDGGINGTGAYGKGSNDFGLF